MGFLGGIAVGSYHNAMVVSVSAYRWTDSQSSGDDQIHLKKAGVTRVRLDGCDVQIEMLDPRQIDADQSTDVSGHLVDDFRVTQEGVALVPEDDLTFAVHFRLPHGRAAHVKVLLKGKQYVFDWLKIAEPYWSSSVVVPPVDASPVGASSSDASIARGGGR